MAILELAFIKASVTTIWGYCGVVRINWARPTFSPLETGIVKTPVTFTKRGSGFLCSPMGRWKK